MPAPRRKTAPGVAAAAAAEIVPEPKGVIAAPPKEEGAYTQEMTEQFSEAQHGSPWRAIVDVVVSVDVPATFARLRDDLQLGERAHAYGEVVDALDRADRNYFDAVLLARAAKLEQERVERHENEQLEVLRTAARKELEAEKGGKKATLEEVRDRMQVSWPDTYESVSRRLNEIHAARAVADGLVDAWASRSQALRKLADRVAPPGMR